jgi:hypothetical protein
MRNAIAHASNRAPWDGGMRRLERSAPVLRGLILF